MAAISVYIFWPEESFGFRTHDAFSIDGWCVAVCGRGRMEAVDFVAVQGIILCGPR